jgi:hypothetical protein
MHKIKAVTALPPYGLARLEPSCGEQFSEVLGGYRAAGLSILLVVPLPRRSFFTAHDGYPGRQYSLFSKRPLDRWPTSLSGRSHSGVSPDVIGRRE